MRAFQDFTAVAGWQTERGGLLGFSGDSGYSEAPHLHYMVRRVNGPMLCPTGEPPFSDGGWLLR